MNKRDTFSAWTVRLAFSFYLFASVLIKSFISYDEIRYGIIAVLLIALFSIFYINNVNLKRCLFFKETVAFMACLAFLLFLTVIKQVVSHDFNLSFVKDTVFMLFPILICFFLVNAEGKGSFDFYAAVYLASGILDFFIRFWRLFTPGNILAVSFLDSYSVFESELVNIFLPLAFYYLFVKVNIPLAFLSAFFCHLSMKRLHELFLFLFIFLFFFKIWRRIKIPGRLLVVITVALCLFPVALDKLVLSPSFSSWFVDKFGVSLNAFTLGRENIYMSMRENLSMINGLGDSRPVTFAIFGGDDMHNDILRLYYECTLLGSCSFIAMYMYISKGSNYSLLYMLYPMTVMMMSPMLSSIEGMTCVYIILVAIKAKYNYRRENKNVLLDGIFGGTKKEAREGTGPDTTQA